MLYGRFFLALCFALVSSSSAVDNAEKLKPGTYKITNPASGTWAHNFPGGHQGPWMTSITMTSQFTGGYQMWEVMPYEEGYRIRNTGSRDWAFARGEAGNSVYGYSDDFTKWYIEPAGGEEYRIHYPNKDLVWTDRRGDEFFQDSIFLEPAQGRENQVFIFEKF